MGALPGLAVIAAAALVAQATSGGVPEEGLSLLDGDRARVWMHGRVNVDRVAWLHRGDVAGRVGELEDRTVLRRLRLSLNAVLHERVELKADYDFSSENTGPADIYVGLLGLPFNVRLGHQKEPFGLEALDSALHIPFVERSPVFALQPFRNTGLRAEGSAGGDRIAWSAGVFREDDPAERGVGRSIAVTARVAGSPHLAADGREVVHLGASVTHREIDGEIRFRHRPEVHVSPFFVDTGPIAASSTDIVAIEAMANLGALSLQAEAVRASVHPETTASLSFGGVYVQASVFLTGEHRPYVPSLANFGRLRPRREFPGAGPGALQLAARYSRLDLDDGDVQGGDLRDLGIGLNWYWRPQARIMLGLVRSELAGAGVATAAQLRAQVDF